MPVTLAADAGIATLFVDGAIDSHAGTALRTSAEEALKGGARKLLVNLQKCKQANSAGLEALVVTARTVHAGGGHLALVGASPLLLDVLKATRLDRRFAVFDSTEQAMTDLRRVV